MLLVAAGGVLQRELGVDDPRGQGARRGSPHRRSAGPTGGALDELVLGVRDLPVARDAALFLVADLDLAWLVARARAAGRGACRMTPAVEAARRLDRVHAARIRGRRSGDGDYAVAVAGSGRLLDSCSADAPAARSDGDLRVSSCRRIASSISAASGSWRADGRTAAGRARSGTAMSLVGSAARQRRRRRRSSTTLRWSGRRSWSAPGAAACRSSSARRI